MKAKILITGASGFVGKNLVGYLEQAGREIKVLTRHQLQDLDPAEIENVETIVHLAGKAHDLKKIAEPKEYYEANFDRTKTLYDAFLQSDAKKFIFVSSVKAARDYVDGILTEEAVPEPQTHYGKSKLMAEDYIRSQPLGEGKSYYILRPCMIHGPGNKGNLNLLYQFVKRGIPYPLAAFENKRSFLTVKNLCFVIKELINQANVRSGIYNVADDEPLSTSEVVAVLASSMNKKVILWQIPRFLIWGIAKLGDQLKLPINTERLRKLTESYLVSNHKITQTLHITLPLQAKDGLVATANSFKDQ